ncbi:unnamed protein product [Caenorhabditis bovis]|uniref:Peptidase A2 domain-containing protein n=1 Tax=Caenorhabditis bovis TaxID=2654633 RepID=A0A8S1F225_9PELO|nr:unnamed protein product [Caenorhabditis bovis]
MDAETLSRILAEQRESLMAAVRELVGPVLAQRQCSSPVSGLDKSKLFNALSSQIPIFSYDRDAGKTFDEWYTRYEDVVTAQGQDQMMEVRENAQRPLAKQEGLEVNVVKTKKDARDPPSPCFRCGGTHWACCFKDAECRKCHKKGHIAECCRQKSGKSKKHRRANAITIAVTSTRRSNRIYRTVNIKMMLDTGAEVTILNIADWFATPTARSPQNDENIEKLKIQMTSRKMKEMDMEANMTPNTAKKHAEHLREIQKMQKKLRLKQQREERERAGKLPNRPHRIYSTNPDDDYGIHDLNSNDETDNEDEPRKKIPVWADFKQVRAVIRQQLKNPPINIQEFCGELPKLDLRIIFGKELKTQKRGSSAVWNSSTTS